jgi:hypothetical protein
MGGSQLSTNYCRETRRCIRCVRPSVYHTHEVHRCSRLRLLQTVFVGCAVPLLLAIASRRCCKQSSFIASSHCLVQQLAHAAAAGGRQPPHVAEVIGRSSRLLQQVQLVVTVLAAVKVHHHQAMKLSVRTPDWALCWNMCGGLKRSEVCCEVCCVLLLVSDWVSASPVSQKCSAVDWKIGEWGCPIHTCRLLVCAMVLSLAQPGCIVVIFISMHE